MGKSKKHLHTYDRYRGKWLDVTIGVVLIVLQSILSVLQDIGEEIFMQTTDFPATLMLGLEGLYAFSVFFIVYVTIGSVLVHPNPERDHCWDGRVRG